PSACFRIVMICASLYRPFFIQNLLRYLAEKILLVNTINFRGDYRSSKLGPQLGWIKVGLVVAKEATHVQPMLRPKVLNS
ncbi:MAG: hypothetical protein P8L68_15485, partial [Paracoccaceae bacterium]|nr:hypothetical protein [Paracoccaceae bacterium]MDG2259885.1 hypothetical protein [Paracoccaceae bacterium]